MNASDNAGKVHIVGKGRTKEKGSDEGSDDEDTAPHPKAKEEGSHEGSDDEDTASHPEGKAEGSDEGSDDEDTASHPEGKAEGSDEGSDDKESSSVSTQKIKVKPQEQKAILAEMESLVDGITQSDLNDAEEVRTKIQDGEIGEVLQVSVA